MKYVKADKSYKDTGPKGGKLVERLACPLCGWIRPIKYGVSKRTGQVREVRFDKMDLIHAPLWRLEKMTSAGRGSPKATIELVDSKSLISLDNDIKLQIISSCQGILKILKSQ